MARHVIVMGVSGSGKSTIAAALGVALDAEVIEADDHHPPANIAKMSAGIPLTDEDRAPWLATLADLTAAAEAAGRPTVLACSALRRSYRDTLRAAAPARSTVTIRLDAPADVIRARMEHRQHFMPPALLDSQLATLEPLDPDELGATMVDDRPVDETVAEALAIIERLMPEAPGAGRGVPGDHTG